MREAVAFAPATIANLAVGFDLLGHSLEALGDRATVRRTDDGQVRVLAVRGCVTELPMDAGHNTAGKALLALCERQPGLGFELELDKGIPLGSGMGGSAASAVAALVAANALLDQPLSIEALYQLALDGEEVASGGRHGDNVAPCLVGGLTIAPRQGAPVPLPVPEGLVYAVVHPDLVLRTRDARQALQGEYALADFVEQSEGLALVLAGLHRGDLELLRRGMKDVLVEPRRKRLIPRFAEVQRAALDCGAIGASIAGAGPSVFGWFADRRAAEQAAGAMQRAFADGGLGSDAHVGSVAGPAARVESCSA